MTDPWLSEALAAASSCGRTGRGRRRLEHLAFTVSRQGAKSKCDDGIKDLDEILEAASAVSPQSFSKPHLLQAALARAGHKALAREVKEYATGRHLRAHPERKRALIASIQQVFFNGSLADSGDASGSDGGETVQDEPRKLAATFDIASEPGDGDGDLADRVGVLEAKLTSLLSGAVQASAARHVLNPAAPDEDDVLEALGAKVACEDGPEWTGDVVDAADHGAVVRDLVGKMDILNGVVAGLISDVQAQRSTDSIALVDEKHAQVQERVDHFERLLGINADKLVKLEAGLEQARREPVKVLDRLDYLENLLGDAADKYDKFGGGSWTGLRGCC